MRSRRSASTRLEPAGAEALRALRVLEFIGDAPENRAANSVEAIAARQTGRDMPLVCDIGGNDLIAPLSRLVTDHRVEQRIVRRADDVRAIPCFADVTHAAADRAVTPAERGEAI